MPGNSRSRGLTVIEKFTPRGLPEKRQAPPKSRLSGCARSEARALRATYVHGQQIQITLLFLVVHDYFSSKCLITRAAGKSLGKDRIDFTILQGNIGQG